MRVAIETFGCTVNQADSEMIARLLEEAGHELVDLASADVVVVNTCCVKSATERKVLKRLAAIPVPVVVTGCLPKADAEAILAVRPDAALVGPRELDQVPAALASLGTSSPSRALEHRRLDKARLGKRRTPGITARIPIAEGCLGVCTYCQTRIARGPLFSFPRGGLVAEARRAVEAGYRELWVTAQDTAAYGADTGDSLASLIADIVTIDGEFRVRIGMCNPDLIAPQLEDILQCMSGTKVYRFLHLPVQSGSDRVLAHMGRRYTREGYLDIVRRCREAVPDILLATDVIVGYPTEGEDNFDDTLDLLRLARPEIVNITRFSPRRGTPAAELRPLPGSILKSRSRRAAELFRQMQREANEGRTGTTVRALVREEGRKGGMLARTDCYRLVAIPHGTPGTWTVARVTGSTPTYLIGEPIEDEKP